MCLCGNVVCENCCGLECCVMIPFVKMFDNVVPRLPLKSDSSRTCRTYHAKAAGATTSDPDQDGPPQPAKQKPFQQQDSLLQWKHLQISCPTVLLSWCPDLVTGLLSFWCSVLQNGSSIDLVSYWTMPLSLLIWFSSDLWSADVLISCPTDLVMCWSTVRTVRHPDSHYLSFIKPITKNEDFAQYCQKMGDITMCVCVVSIGGQMMAQAVGWNGLYRGCRGR